MPRVRGHAVVLVSLLGCGTNTRAHAEAEAGDPVPPTSARAACLQPEVAGAVAFFAGKRCGWIVRSEGEALALVSLDPEASNPTALGAAPDACATAPCDFIGRELAIGPALVVQRRSAQSEMPSGVWLGFVNDAGALSFVDLWDGAGQSVHDEGTELGPAHTLAPFICAQRLALEVATRLEGYDVSAAPEALRARAGFYADPESVTPLADASGCKPAAWKMP